MSPGIVVTVALTGAVIGFVSGMFGVGGGFLLVPVLNILLGIPIEFAVGAGACQVLGPATTALLARRITFNDLQFPLTLLGGLSVGVISGTGVFQSARDAGTVTIGGRDVPLAELSVLATYFVMMTSMGLFGLYEVGRSHAGRPVRRGWLREIQLPPYGRIKSFDRMRLSIPVIAWFGLTVGFLAGFLGMSGGLILIPGLIYLFNVRAHAASIASLVIVWLVAMQSTIVHAWAGRVDLGLVMALLVGGTIGARFGADLSLKLRGPQFRRSFGWLLLTAALLVGIRLIGLLLH